jgi:hypothetical protein
MWTVEESEHFRLQIEALGSAGYDCLPSLKVFYVVEPDKVLLLSVRVAAPLTL